MALGCADESAAVNQLRSDRACVDELAILRGFCPSGRHICNAPVSLARYEATGGLDSYVVACPKGSIRF